MQKIAQIITKIIDFFYSPFKKWFPSLTSVVTEEIFRYGFCGAANMFFDWVLYFFLYNFVIGHDLIYIDLPDFLANSIGPTLCLTPHIATFCIVFPVTLLTGFWLNKYVTFTQSDLNGAKQLFRYILIVALNLLVNYVGLKLCVDIWGWYPTPSKMVITLLTVIISFFGQKYFSFRKSTKD